MIGKVIEVVCSEFMKVVKVSVLGVLTRGASGYAE